MLEYDEFRNKRVTIVELQTHHVFLLTQLKIFSQLNVTVTLITTKFVVKQIKNYLGINHRVNIILVNNDKSYLTVLSKLKNISSDYIWFNTVQGRLTPLLIFYKKSVTTILVAGRPNDWFGRIGTDKVYSVRNYINKLLLFVTRSIIFKSNKIDYICVHNNYQKYFIQSHGFNKIIMIPFAHYQRPEYQSFVSNSNNNIKFVIPGSIEQERRDYLGFIKAIKYLKPSRPLEIIFLGRPKGKYGDIIINEIKLFNIYNPNVKLKYYERYIEENEYIKNVINSDFSLNIINPKYYKNGVICSGIVENIRLGVPGVFPKNFAASDDFIKSNILYNNFGDLVIILNKLMTTDLLEEKKKNAKKYSLNYTVDKIINRGLY